MKCHPYSYLSSNIHYFRAIRRPELTKAICRNTRRISYSQLIRMLLRRQARTGTPVRLVLPGHNVGLDEAFW